MASLSSFQEYEISSTEMRNLSFVLKKQNLHYVDLDRRYMINDYVAMDSEPYQSHEMHIIDHIVIPAGAKGVCTREDSRHIVIDFGEGIQVPFILSDENNRPKDELIVGERVYKLSKGHQKARLYFDPGTLRR
jgi:hypothetical protein